MDTLSPSSIDCVSSTLTHNVVYCSGPRCLGAPVTSSGHPFPPFAISLPFSPLKLVYISPVYKLHSSFNQEKVPEEEPEHDTLSTLS